VVAAAIVGGAVAGGVTLGILRLQARTNPQRVDLGSTVTIKEEDATTGVAQKAAPAVVSIVTNETTLSHGSGFLVTSDGYIVTNMGVVARSQVLEVLSPSDSRRHDARLVDYDCATGVAVLKVDQVSNLPTLAFGDSSGLRTGQSVIAVGGSLDTDRGVTHGVVSALHGIVSIGDVQGGTAEREMSNVIQTDARIGPGVSGAPLLNVGGQVIGVTMVGPAQGGQTASFALSSGDLQPEVEQIVQTGLLVVPSLGAQTLQVSADAATIRGTAAGARISTLVAGGPAEHAGLKPGDVITQLDDQRLDDAHPLAQVLRQRFKPDQRVTVGYWRGGATGQVQLTLLGEHPSCT
jgi:putative serine protease PepD